MAGLAVIEAFRAHRETCSRVKGHAPASPTKGVTSSFQLTHTEPIIAGSSKCLAMTFASNAM